ncbi:MULTISPECIES: hypothetical protein [unclassified Rhodanobacter]|jgi:hypothetical protein|uniref:Uncharacterized protein n=1 Tax=Rhodanobacter humi TaxID=1888173 RepID=A0ABV4ARP3_9GAMM
MKSLTLACALALGLGLPFAGTTAPAMPAMQAAPQAAAAPAAPKLHAALRGLWHGHVVHTRAYAMAVEAGNAAAATKAADDVVANAKQIANAVAGFYGADAGTGMLKLLAGHWAGVKALTDATHAGDKAAADKAMQELATNAGEIAKFLHGANPANWPEATVDGLLLEHVADHQSQVGEIMRGDKAGEAKTWAMMQEHMNTIADALAGGIAAQFPTKVQ